MTKKDNLYFSNDVLLYPLLFLLAIVVVFWIESRFNINLNHLGIYPRKIEGLIAATADQSEGIQWWNGTNIVTGATGTAIGTGLTNTNAIIAAQGSGSYAASIARDYNGGGYTDWFLPSKDELNQLYVNKAAIGGGFEGDYYWSSTEYDSRYAWVQDFNFGNQNYSYKDATFYVRAVRAF